MIQDYFDCLVIGIGHAGHDNPDREHGSIVFAADADTRIKISSPAKYLVELKMMKQRDGEEWLKEKYYKLAQVEQSLVVTHVDQSQIDRSDNIKGAVETGTANNARAEAMNVLNATAGPVIYTQRKLAQMIAENTSIPFSTVRKYLSTWHDEPDSILKGQHVYNADTTSGSNLQGYKVFKYLKKED